MATEKSASKTKLLVNSLTPRQIVKELDKYIIGQKPAKRSVAIALRNRLRRQTLEDDMRDEVAPKNIIMIGTTGVGKTEIARRLARLVDAPFIKVEASKFTEVGYVGRDVESMIRDLTDLAVNTVKSEQAEIVKEKAATQVEERLLDVLLPTAPRSTKTKAAPTVEAAMPIVDGDNGDLPLKFEVKIARFDRNTGETTVSETSTGEAITDASRSEKPDIEGTHEELAEDREAFERHLRTRDKFRKMLRDGKLENKEIELDVKGKSGPFIEVFSPLGLEEMDMNFREMFGSLMPSQSKKRRVTIAEARQIILQEESEKLIDMDKVVSEAIERAENSGIVFLDEVDKIAGRRDSSSSPDVSREGVQRDILPIVEGCTVTTKYGMVKTDHILFIAAGAFHASKPSDLIPELQGRFPIRVELNSLDQKDFKRILTEPKNALVKQYVAMMATENLQIEIKDSAIDEISALAFQVNEAVEDIGARRLHTIMEKLFEELSFDAPELEEDKFVISEEYVRTQLADIVEDQDLSKYIL